jgi:glycosyltransferase involved in cell wall biosynthesis
MRIAFVTHVVGFCDGQGRVNYEIVRAALDAGMLVTIVAESCADDLASHGGARFVKISISSLPTQLLRTLSFAVRSTQWLLRHRRQFDLIQANGFVTFASADIVPAHFVHGAWLHSRYSSLRGGQWSAYAFYQRANTKINSYLERTAFARAKRVVAVSEYVANELRSVGVKNNQIAVIVNGVDTQEFCPKASDRASFLLPNEVTMFLFAGDIRTHRKNLDGVLRAIARVEGLHIAVAGELQGSPYPKLARELGIPERVHFLGRVDRMSELMVATDALICPSRYDPFALVVLEAMASGLPVVTAKTTGASAVLGDPEWILNDPEDTTELIRMIKLLANDAKLRFRLGETNRAKALAHNWSSMASSYLDLYRRIYDEKRPGNRLSRSPG